MRFSLISSALLSLLLPFLSSFYWILAIRLIQGITLAGLPAIAMAYLSEEISKKSLASAMGLYISGNALGATFGRFITSVLAEQTNWKTAVFIIGIISVFASILFTYLLPRSNNFIATHTKFNMQNILKPLLSQLLNYKLLCLFFIGFILLGTNVSLFNYMSFTLINKPYFIPYSLISFIFLLYFIGIFSSIGANKLIYKYGITSAMFVSLSLILLGVIITLTANAPTKLIGTGLSVYGFFSGHSIASSWVAIISDKNKAQSSSLYLFFYYMGPSIIGTIGGFLWSVFGWMGVAIMNIILISIAFILTIIISKYRFIASKISNNI